MLHLIIKDILIQKRTFLYALLYTIVASTGFFTMINSSIILYVLSPMAIIYMLITYAASYDDKNKSEFILNSLPLKRNQIVISKYISAFVFAAIGIIYSLTIGFIGSATGILLSMSISLSGIVSVLAFTCIFSSIYFPICFKFGGVKANQFILILIMFITFLPLLAFANKNNNILQRMYHSIISATSLSLNYMALIVGLIMFIISLMVSLWIYNNKEY